MRQPWSGVVLGFFNTRNSSSVPVANHSIAHDENQNWLRDWLSMKNDMSLTFNGTCTNFHSNGETFGNATYVGDHDASVVPLTSTMIDLLAMSKGEKIRKQVSNRYFSNFIPWRMFSLVCILSDMTDRQGDTGARDLETGITESKERQTAQNS